MVYKDPPPELNPVENMWPRYETIRLASAVHFAMIFHAKTYRTVLIGEARLGSAFFAPALGRGATR
jgi:hypothetical protein